MPAPANALELDTPALYVDLDMLEHNIVAMQEQCTAWGVKLRPHTKTHKIPEIARMQLDAGACGITVAKVGEAEILPGDDVLIAYPLMSEKVARLSAVAKTRRVTVVVDSVEAARGLAPAGADIGTLVEVDVGVGRCGVQSPDEAVAVARACRTFRGIFFFPSWLDEQGFRAAERIVRDTLAALETAGLHAEIVSGGSTPGAPKTPLVPQTTEIRPGTYVFQDANSLCNGFARVQECALRVLTTVVSTSVKGQCIIDGGSKTFSSDATVNVGTFGLFPDRPSWTMKKMNEEHGYVSIETPAKVGEKVWVIPSHACPTVNLHDEIWYGRDGKVDGSWKVAARGRVR